MLPYEIGFETASHGLAFHSEISKEASLDRMYAWVRVWV